MFEYPKLEPRMNEYQTDHQELLGAMVEVSKTRKRVVKRFPTLTFDRDTLQLLGVEERVWRGREVPREAETRQLLLTAYLGLVVNNEPFQSWAPYLRKTFPDMKPDQGDAFAFAERQMRRLGSFTAWVEGDIATLEDALQGPVFDEYLRHRQQDRLGDYEWINSNVLYGRGDRVPIERRYLCDRCGLHFLATGLFASAPHGPRITHQLVWDPDISLIIGQTELGVFSIPKDSTGHGRAGMWLDNYGQLETVTKNLFLQQVWHESPSALAERSNSAPAKLKKELGRARDVLGIRRRKGNQRQWWARDPGQLCGQCRSSNR